MRKFIPVLGPETTEFVESESTSSFGYENGVRFRNGYFEFNQAAQENSGKVEFIKRPGITSTVLNSPALVGTSTYNIHGNMFFGTPIILWGKFSGGNHSHQTTYGTTVLAAPAGWYSSAGTPETLGQVLLLDNNLYGGNIAVVSVTNYAGLITFGGAAWNRITDADWVTAFGPGTGSHTEFAAMDGYVFKCTGSNKVYNSDINNPASWGASSYITSAIYPGAAVSLQRYRQYLILFKTDSIEFLENQGNPTPGSPLGFVKNLAQPIGCSGTTLGQPVGAASDGLVWVGKSQTGALGVYKLGADLVAKKISDSFIDAMLIKGGYQGSIAVIPFKGHEYISIPCSFSGVNRNIIYDNTNGTWMEWTSFLTAGPYTYTFSTQTYALVDGNGETYVSVPPIVASSSTNNKKLSHTQYGDYDTAGGTTTSIEFKWVTQRLDFGTLKRKFMSSLEFFYSMIGGPSITLPNAIVSLYYYDDDASTGGTASRSADASQTGLARVIWRRFGSFKRRRFVFSVSNSTTPFRIQGAEVDINMAEDGID